MKILLSWLKEFINLENISVDKITYNLNKIGIEVESTDTIDNLEYLKILVVGHVIECKKHPNADRLSCTKVDIGNNTILNIVCGAPNVKEGLKVVVAKENTKLKTFLNEEFVIKKTKIRNEFSEGMLCAEDEIGISSDHNCIIELDQNLEIGTKIDEIYKDKIKKDYLINAELTPNLSYCNSYLGIARDLKCVFGTDLNIKFEHDFNKIPKIDSSLIDIKINPQYCKRFSCLLIKNVKIKESPDFIKKRLIEIGQKPINNIVDLTNYLMFEYGQPLHVYDFNKIKGNITVDIAKNKIFTALNNKNYTLAEDITVSDENKNLSLAGIIGGSDSSVTKETTDILIECAYFNPVNIRKSASRLNINTEASYRFSRDTDESNILTVLWKYYEYLSSQQQDLNVIGYLDINNAETDNKIIKTSFQHINKTIGQDIEKDTIIDILNKLEIEINIDNDNITAIIPNYRKNIEYENDIVHEILRFYGYNNLNYNSSIEHKLFENNRENHYKNIKNDCNFTCDIKNSFSNILCSNGFYEIRTNSLISKNDVISEVDDLIELKNPSSNCFNVLRNNLIYNGLEVIKFNLNRGNDFLKLFEFGNIYKKNNGNFIEEKHLAIYLTGSSNIKFLNEVNNSDFLTIKKYVLKLFNCYRINVDIRENRDEIKTFINGVEIYHNDENIGYFGKVNDDLTTKFEIKQDVYFADLYFDKIINIIKNCSRTEYKKISKYPIINRDLSIIIDKNVKFVDIENVIKNADSRIISVKIFDIYFDKTKNDKKTYSVSFFIEDINENLDNNKINEIFNNVIYECENKLNAIINRG